ncbi:MAG: ABC transporter permease [Chloroflexota bacterium]
MNPRRLRAITRRIIDQFRRDPRTLGLIFVVPIAITALLGWVLRDQQVVPARVAVVDLDQTAGGRLAAAIRSAATAGGLELVEGLADERAARDALAGDRADVVVVIPPGFGASLASGATATLTIATQGADPLADGSKVGQLQQAIGTALLGLSPGAAPRLAFARETVFLSPDADVLDALAPVFIGYFGYFFVFILTGISFLRERIGGTLERLLATPITKPEIVLGYSLGFGIFATLQVIVLLTFVLMRLDVPALGPLPSFTIGLDVPIAGSPLLAFVLALLLALGAVNLGIFLSTFARTELQILQFIPIVIVPQGLLSGIFWPVDSLPAVLQPVARVLPLTYAVEALRDVMIRGHDLSAAGVQLAIIVLAAIAALFVALAAATIRREVA